MATSNILESDMIVALVSSLIDDYANELSKLTEQKKEDIQTRIKLNADDIYRKLKSKSKG